MDITLDRYRVRARMYAADAPGSIHARIMSYRDDQLVAGSDECPATAVPVPLLGGLSVSDFPPHRTQDGTAEGGHRTRMRTRTAKTTLCELCTAIPIQALR
jgi:hypothetical protein